MHNAAFEALGLDLVYLPLATPPQQLGLVLEGLMSLGALGVNVTIPYKHDVIPNLDEIDPLAQRIGAVNTILFKNGRKIGYNTDGAGFVASLEQEEGFYFSGKRVAILGAGGAAYGVADQCLDHGAASMVIANRTLSKAQALADHLQQHFDQQVAALELNTAPLAEAVALADIVINTTSLGLATADASPVNSEWLSQNQLVADLIYNPVQTNLLRDAAQRGLRTVNGLGMLIYQGVLAFKIWTGLDPQVEVMRAAVEEALNIT